jgi:hypothetical protein
MENLKKGGSKNCKDEQFLHRLDCQIKRVYFDFQCNDAIQFWIRVVMLLLF